LTEKGRSEAKVPAKGQTLVTREEALKLVDEIEEAVNGGAYKQRGFVKAPHNRDG